MDSLSKTINAYLALDPESKMRLQQLRDKVITIELLPWHVIFQCEFNAEGIVIHDENTSSDAKISGTPLQMTAMLLVKEDRHQFFAEDLKIEGNVELGQQVIFLFDHLHIDWEEYLSHLTGDVSAHHIGRLLRNTTSWLKKTEQNTTDNIRDYIHEEKTWLPAKEALQDLFNDIDVLRMDTDRIEAKIKMLAEGIQE